MIKNIFSKTLLIGTDAETPSLEKKRNKMLNFSSVLLGVTVLFFIVFNFLDGYLGLYVGLNYAFQLIMIAAILYFNDKKKWEIARGLFIILSLAVLIVQNNILFKGFYGEYLYIVIPLLCMFFFNKKVIYFLALFLSIALFYVPNLVLNIYPDAYFGYSNTVFAFVGIFSIVYFFKTENTKNELQLSESNQKLDIAFKELEIAKQNELAVSNLKALKSQMNPHFIFNLLNSIQALVMKGDVDASYTYMTKFATLVRQTLHFSDSDLVELEDEIDLLKIYLDLEKLRFSKDFEYQIIDNDIEGIEIPPLLIQPFIENALVHGLLHKAGKKTLKLEFEIKDKLICTITDNGIGRTKSKEIKARQESKHESFSTQAIEKRFKILSETYKGEFGFKYEDVFENGEFVATQVKLFIPYKQAF